MNRRFITLMLTLTILLSLCPIATLAAPIYDGVDTYDILEFGKTYEGRITRADPNHCYTFTVEEEGFLRINFIHERAADYANDHGMNLTVYNEKGTFINYGYHVGIREWSYGTTNQTHIPANTYVVAVSSGTTVWNYFGSYKFTIEFEPGVSTPSSPYVTVTASATPSHGGTVSDARSVMARTTVGVRATPNPGWIFAGWYENDSQVSTSELYTFFITADRDLEARFTQTVTQTSIPNNHSQWAAEELIKANEMNLIPLSLLDPSIDYTKPITRAEFAAVAVKTYEALAGIPAIPIINNPFTDCNDVEVLKAYNIGAVNGTSLTTFSPDDLLTREQAATMLTRVFKRIAITGWTLETDNLFTLQYEKPAPFADDEMISDYAKDSVYFMNANGIITGVGNNMFAPRATTPEQQALGYAQATREQSLLIAVRMVENLG